MIILTILEQSVPGSGGNPRHFCSNAYTGTSCTTCRGQLPTVNIMTISLEIKAKALTSQLSKCESDINQAAQNLEKTFQSINDKTKQCGCVKNPIRFYRTT